MLLEVELDLRSLLRHYSEDLEFTVTWIVIALKRATRKKYLECLGSYLHYYLMKAC